MQTLTPYLLLLPLAGFAILGLGGRYLSRTVSAIIGCGTVFIAFCITLSTFFGLSSTGAANDQTLWTWVQAGNLTIPVGIFVDQLSITMMLVVTGVGFLIHVYSIGYMDEEDQSGFSRFFSFLNFFIFMMSLLVLADNFLMLLIGWAGVGLASFLLIGFWFNRPAAAAAARKAFVVNVIGDFGLMIAIFLLVAKTGTLQYANLLTSPMHFAASDQATTAIALMLLVAAAAKSAQLPLHVWLADAMEGPTPVSALIHAATMVTAGVYLVARCHIIFAAAPIALTVIAIMGGLSAIFAATIALFQNDIKRILAYSTMSQLGYMFMGESVGANNAAIFHLTTHAFFKALLFMAAGGVIHALGGEQDIRRMSGLRTKLPITFAAFMVGGLALAGIPPFAGFWSKDAILGAILAKASEAGASPLYYLLWVGGILTAVLTGFYIFRLIFTVFLGPLPAQSTRSSHAHVQGVRSIHEVGTAMAAPMIVLLVLAIIGGFNGTPLNDLIGGYLRQAVGTPFGAEGGLLWTSLIAGVVAGSVVIFFAWQRYGARRQTFVANTSPIYQLLTNAYYIDAMYNTLIVQPIVALSNGLQLVLEGAVLDGGSRGFATLTGRISDGLRRFQSGYARNYALGIFGGALLIVLYYVYQAMPH